MKPTDFAKVLNSYLACYLPGQRNLSINTIKSSNPGIVTMLNLNSENFHYTPLCWGSFGKNLAISI